MATLMSGANYLWHFAGWNEAGMHCSMAKFIVDAEQCAMGYRMVEGIQWNDFDKALAPFVISAPVATISVTSIHGKNSRSLLHARDARQ